MIKLASDTINKEDLSALADWLQTEPQLTKGPLVEEFEKKFAIWMGAEEAIMVNSGSSANLLLLHSLICLGLLNKGDKVVVPAISWSTDLSPIIQLGLEPVLCDANLMNVGVCTIALESILKAHKPKALLLVSVLGMAPDMHEIVNLCRQYDCLLLEDNCESLGSKSDGQLLGTFGFASTTSLYFGHHMSTIEGGMIFTNDEKLALTLRMCRAHGWDRDLPAKEKERLKADNNISDFNSKYTFYYSGFNFRPTEINAFLGLRQLEKVDSFISARKQIFDYYQHAIRNDYWKPMIPKEDFTSNLGYPLITPKRDKIVLALEDICETRPFISGNMAQQPFYKKWTVDSGQLIVNALPNAEMIHKFGMYLPNHPGLKEEELYTICKCVNSIIGQ